MRKQVTEKLFYNKFAYKLICRNDLAGEFRNNRLNHVSKLLDSLQLAYENGDSLEIDRYRSKIKISPSSFEDAKILYNEFKKNKKYRLRIQYKELTVYSNDKVWLKNLSLKLRMGLEWWEPLEDLNPLTPGYAYLKRKIDYKYRVYLKGTIPQDGATWLDDNNRRLVKVGNTLKKYLEEGIRVDDMYLYAKSDRVLTILQMIMPGNIRSIIKVVCLDKNA